MLQKNFFGGCTGEKFGGKKVSRLHREKIFILEDFLRVQKILEKSEYRSFFMFTLEEVEAILAGVPDAEALIEKFRAADKMKVAASVVLSFGKYKGSTLQDVLREDQQKGLQYCRWLLRAKEEDTDILFVKEKFPEVYEEAKAIVASFKAEKKRKL